MKMLDRLIGRLHRIFDKTPHQVPVATFAAGVGNPKCTISVLDMYLHISTNLKDVSIPLAGTLSDLSADVSGVTGWPVGYVTMTIAPGYENMQSWGLIDSHPTDTIFDGNVYAATSFLYNEFQVYGRVFHEQAQRVDAVLAELYPNTADGEWLDYWMQDFFTIPRLNSETDQQYFYRAASEIFALKVNNVALEVMIKRACGVTVDVKDTGWIEDGVFFDNDLKSLTNNAGDIIYDTGSNTLVQLKSNQFAVFIKSKTEAQLTTQEKETIKRICTTYRAAGCLPVYLTRTGLLETNVFNENINNKDLLSGPINRRWRETTL